ncbi:MAG: hypothetical protein LBQ47_01295 [Endomicrobium sp.]|jgi:tetratricopeptide (TPR) repeat protein|nr:hypothetical protein [Endomicrobium sp.]
MKKIKYAALCCAFVLLPAARAFADNIILPQTVLLLNYDADSEAMGSTVASLSQNSLAFLNFPSANFRALANRADFSGVAAYDGLYGSAASIVTPTKYGNLSFAAGYNELEFAKAVTADNRALSYGMFFAANYTYPFVSEMPVYADKGGAGLTVKASRIASKDNSATFLSADLGAHYNVYKGLWAFAALKNLGGSAQIGASPAFDVPGSLNFALRYEFPYNSKPALTGDFIQFFSKEDGGTGIALGAEFSPLYPATFKIGWRKYSDSVSGGPTFGLFLNFGSLSFGYSYSSSEADYYPKHTLNLGMMFGIIKNQSKAFDYWLGYNFNLAKEAYEKKDYISARQQLEEILAIYPDHAPSKDYLKRIVYDLDSNDRVFEAQISKWLRRAELEFYRNNLINARGYYYRVLGVDPENSEAEEGLSKVNEKLALIEVQENRKRREKEIIALWSEAMNLYNNGDFVYARDKLKALLDIDPENAGAKKYIDIIEPKVNQVNVMHADQLFTQAMDYYNMADFERAAKYFNAVYTSDPSRSDAKEYYELSRKALNLSYEEFSQTAREKSLRTKTRLADKDDSVLSSNQKIQKEMEIYYNEAIDLFNKAKYDEALRAFVSLREKAVRNNYYDLNQSIKDYSQKSRQAISALYYKEAADLIKKERYEESLAKLNKALDYDESNNTIRREKDSVLNELSQQYFDAGIKAYSSKNIKKAVELLEKSLEYNPKKTEAAKALDRIKILGE